MVPSGQDSIMMVGAFLLGTMGWAVVRRFQIQVPRSKTQKLLDEDEEPEQVCTSTGNSADACADKAGEPHAKAQAAACACIAASKKTAFQKKQARKARKTAEKKLTTEEAGDEEPEPEELASASAEDIASGPPGPDSATEPAAESPGTVAPNEEVVAATEVEEPTSGPASETEPPAEELPAAATPTEAPGSPTSAPSPAPEKEATSPSSRSPTDRDRMKLEKKLREVAKLEERAAAGELLDSLQLEKMAKSDQLREEFALLNAKEATQASASTEADPSTGITESMSSCDEGAASPEPSAQKEEPCTETAEAEAAQVDDEEEEDEGAQVQAWSEVPPVQAWQEVKEVGAWADVECSDDEGGPVNLKEPLMCGLYRDGTVVPGKEPKESTREGSKAKEWTDGSSWSGRGGWEKNGKSGGWWSWKESWGERRTAQAQRRGDAWMKPVDPFAKAQAMPCGATAVSDDVCWKWQKYGCCEKFSRGKCGWEHPPLEGQTTACLLEDAPQVQYCYQLIEVDAATLEMMGAAQVPVLMPAGAEMLAQGGPEEYDQASCQRGDAYWQDWEEERVEEPGFPMQPLPVGWTGPMTP